MAYDLTPETTKLLAATHEKICSYVSSQVGEGSKLLKIMQNRGAVVTGNTGHAYSFSIRKSESALTQWYDKDVTMARQAEEQFMRLFKEPKAIRQPVTLSEIELSKNAGDMTKIFDLYKESAANATEDMIETLNAALYSDNSATSKMIDGLESIVEEDNTYCNLDRSAAAYAFWRSNIGTASGDFSANGLKAFDDMVIACERLGRNVDLIVTNVNTYANYQADIRGKITVDNREMFDLGIDHLTHGKIPVIWDRDCTANRAYFLNTKSEKGYKIMVWGKQLVNALPKEEYAEGITFGFRALLLPLLKEPRICGRVENCDTI